MSTLVATSPREYITFQEVPRDYRTEIPNIINEMKKADLISNSDFILYYHYRKIAGENGGCWIGTRGLEKETGLSDKTITKSKKILSQKFDILGGKSLIQIIPGDRKKEEADTVIITDIWPENFHFFKKRLTCSNPDDRGVVNQTTGVSEIRRHKKEPFKKEPIKNPPLSSPQKKIPDKPVPKVSLRSEEEEIFSCLKGTALSPKEQRRLSKEYSEEEVIKAIEISKTQPIKKSLMALILHILNNPEDWEGDLRPQKVTVNQQRALQYNKRLSKIFPKMARDNEKRIIEHETVVIISREGHCQISLKSDEFEKDIRKAEEYLNEKTN